MAFFGKSRRAQAAMEFLMTYGWAILVVLVVIGALAYFGVLSPSNLLPEKCTFPVSLSCTDHVIAPTWVGLAMQNGAGRDMIVRGLTVTSDAITPPGTLCSTEPLCDAPTGTDVCPVGGAFGSGPGGCSGGGIFRNGETKTFTNSCVCEFSPTGRDKNRYNVTLYYSWLDSPSIMHQLQGEMLARRP